MSETCMFCLDEIKSTELAFNPIGCECQFRSHGACLQSWFEQKNQYECPICHAVSIPNPIQLQPVYQIVYVQQHRELERNMRRSQKKCAAIVCLTLLFWGVMINILEAVLTR